MSLTPALGSTLTVTGNLTISAPATYDTVIVMSTGILTANAPLTVVSYMTVSGRVTHSAYSGQATLPGLVLSVGGTLDVQSTGLITADGLGLRGGSKVVGSDPKGETYNAAGTGIVRAVPQNTGGGYGGYGGADNANTGGQPNGLMETPDRLGSGGGGRGATFAVGGNGGGRIRITAGTLNVIGTITANSGTGGDEGFIDAPTGSGGSIWITASQVTGTTTGVIRANSNRRTDGYTDRWSGSGGRIAIYYDVMTFPDTRIQAQPVSGFEVPGAAGTIYLKDNAQTYADVMIDNGGVTTTGGATTSAETPIRSTQDTFRSVRVLGRGRMVVVPADIAVMTIEQPVSVSETSALRLAPGANVSVTNSSGFDLEILGSSSLNLGTGSVLNANAVRMNGSTLNTSIDLSYPTGSDFELSGNGTVNVGSGRVFSIEYFDERNFDYGTFSLPATSRLDIASNIAVIGGGAGTVRLIKDGTFGTTDQLDSLTVRSNGVITHSGYSGQATLPGLVLNVGGTLDVQASGQIVADGIGLRGGARVVPTDPKGETYDTAGTGIVRAVPQNTGGGYGGYGGADNANTGGQPNGLMETPDRLGSGGAGRGATFAVGGNGGGRIRITAGTLNVLGTISVAGGTGGDENFIDAPTGSGGSIWITASQVTGTAPGLIRANSNRRTDGYTDRWSGSGGRIAIYYDVMTFPDTRIQAQPVSGFQVPGAAGTIYLKDNAQTYADVIIDNGGITTSAETPIRSTEATFRSVSVRQRGVFGPDDVADIVLLHVHNNGVVNVREEVRIIGELLVESGGVLRRP